MKNNKTTRTAPPRLTRIEPKAKRFERKTTENQPRATAHRFAPAARHQDFLALCFYPGMGDHSTAA